MLTDVVVPDPLVVLDDSTDPEQQAMLADTLGSALIVGLGDADRLTRIDLPQIGHIDPCRLSYR